MAGFVLGPAARVKELMAPVAGAEAMRSPFSSVMIRGVSREQGGEREPGAAASCEERSDLVTNRWFALGASK